MKILGKIYKNCRKFHEEYGKSLKKLFEKSMKVLGKLP